MSRTGNSLWELVDLNPRIDATTLARAVEEASEGAEDFRTCLLIRDSLSAIEHHWGEQRFRTWIENSSQRARIRQICDEVTRDAVHEHGFPSLKRRIVDATRPDKVISFFNDLAAGVKKPT